MYFTYRMNFTYITRRKITKQFLTFSTIKLDIDPRRDVYASLMSSYVGACWDILECWFQFFITCLNASQNSISNVFEKKKSIFLGFSCCSTGEGLSIDVSITNVGLIRTGRQTWFWNPHMETCRHANFF